MTASGAIDAAVEAARKAVSDKLRRGDEFTTDDVIVVSVKAAARVLLAAERERVARRIEAYNATLGRGDDVFQDEGKWYLDKAAELVRTGKTGGESHEART